MMRQKMAYASATVDGRLRSAVKGAEPWEELPLRLHLLCGMRDRPAGAETGADHALPPEPWCVCA